MRLIAELLSRQDPAKQHTLLTRIIVSLIILFASLVYAGFFGVMGAVVVYLLFVELQGVALHWALSPIGLALIFGLRSALKDLLDYWRNHGHGQV